MCKVLELNQNTVFFSDAALFVLSVSGYDPLFCLVFQYDSFRNHAKSMFIKTEVFPLALV